MSDVCSLLVKKNRTLPVDAFLKWITFGRNTIMPEMFDAHYVFILLVSCKCEACLSFKRWWSDRRGKQPQFYVPIVSFHGLFVGICLLINSALVFSIQWLSSLQNNGCTRILESSQIHMEDEGREDIVASGKLVNSHISVHIPLAAIRMKRWNVNFKQNVSCVRKQILGFSLCCQQIL